METRMIGQQKNWESLENFIVTGENPCEMWANFLKNALFSISWAPANHNSSFDFQFFNFRGYLNLFSFQNGLTFVFIMLSSGTMKLNVKVPVLQKSENFTKLDRICQNWEWHFLNKFIWVRKYIDGTFGSRFVWRHTCVRKYPEKLAKNGVHVLEIWMIKYLKS